jgi:integrase
MFVRRGRLRPRWRHGCGGTCGRKYGGHCPQRQPERDETSETKSRAGRRGIGLPAELVELLRAHRVEQDRERETAAQLWTDGGWLFATPTGGPLNPRTDYDEWKRLLGRAGVRDGRMHDARHTAATVLLLLGVPERAVMGIMGWSTRRWRRATSTSPHRSNATSRAASEGSSGRSATGRRTASETRCRNAGRVRVDPSGVSAGEAGGSGGI